MPRTKVELYGISKKGWNFKFELEAEAVDSDDALLNRLKTFIPKIEAMSISPKPVGQQPTVSNVTNKAATQAQPQTSNKAPETFEAETLVANMNDGKTYWKVKGGFFKKFGVTVWPEVLKAAGFDTEKLNPAQQYDLSNFTAVFVKNDQDKPQKVIELKKKGNQPVQQTEPEMHPF